MQDCVIRLGYYRTALLETKAPGQGQASLRRGQAKATKICPQGVLELKSPVFEDPIPLWKSGLIKNCKFNSYYEYVMHFICCWQLSRLYCLK